MAERKGKLTSSGRLLKRNIKLSSGTRIILPGFENSFAFKSFMTLLARMFGESEASRIVQLEIEADIPPTNGEILPLTQLERLAYFRNNFRKFKKIIFNFKESIFFSNRLF